MRCVESSEYLHRIERRAVCGTRAMTTTPILLVEDEPNIVFFFQHIAEKIGIINPLHVAKDGQEALDYLEGAGEFHNRQSHPLPGLVVLDLKLPHVSGFEVLTRVRANPGLRKLIVVMLTSSPSDADVDQAYALGVNAYLVKPMGLEKLTATLQAIKDFWLTHNHAPRLADSQIDPLEAHSAQMNILPRPEFLATDENDKQ